MSVRVGLGQGVALFPVAPRAFSREDVFGPKLYGPTTGFASLPQASSPIDATPQYCRCGDLTLARPGVPCGRCGELP